MRCVHIMYQNLLPMPTPKKKDIFSSSMPNFAKIYNAQGYVDYEIGRTFETSIIAHEIINEWYTNALLYRSPENRRDAAVEYFANFSGPNEIYSQLQDLFDLCDECRQ